MESFPRPLEAGSLGFAATVDGDQKGRFSITLDAAVLESPLLGEGADQKAGWNELLREVCEAASGEILAKTGKTATGGEVRTRGCGEPGVAGIPAAFRRSRLDDPGARRGAHAAGRGGRRGRECASPAAGKVAAGAGSGPSRKCRRVSRRSALPAKPGIELLLDVELEATLRFGCREMPLGEILELGPGDVVQLDRHISDPVDLIVGDKIVARGDVVLVNGNFGLRVTEVAAPRKRLESIRCLF